MAKIFYKGSILFVVIAIMTVNFSSQAQTSGEFTKKQALKWYKKWSKDHPAINVDHILDIQQLATQYNAHKAWWDFAFEYLKNTDLAALPLGRFQIDGDRVTTVVSEGPSKEYLNTKWESHQGLADIHFLISGGEMVGVAPISSATVTRPFNGTVNTAIYTADGKVYPYRKGGYFIFFPDQVHQPGVKAPGYDTYKKIVVKVKVE
jgi:YhcH/YjgK/YiaL family protein